MKTIRILVVLALIGAAFAVGWRLASRRAAPGPGAAASRGRKILYWVDPMHPAYRSDKPGIAPDCGMKLEPVYESGPAPLAPGMVQVSPERQQLIGVRYGTAEFTSGVDTIRAVGKVAIDETRISHVHSRTEGWIEKVYVNFTGDVVRQGQPMLTIYSPELLASQQEYLLALRAREAMRNSPVPGVAANNDALVSAARRRLQLWDLSDAAVAEVERTGKPMTNITLYAPASGYVMTRNAFPNQKVTPETELFMIVDLSRVWVLASVFEYETPRVRLGQVATVSLPYNGGRSIRARVSYLQPQVDAQTRTVQVRLDLANPGLALKPDMFVNVELASAQPARLTVPSEAVLDTGLKKTVFVALGDGHFEPREIETGERIGDRIQVLKGLSQGEQIVTSGNFLINSESQLRAAAGAMGAMPGMPGMPAPAQSPASPGGPVNKPKPMPGTPGMSEPAPATAPAAPEHTGHGEHPHD
ncbi:MAG: efflux RND transporter periplasmic adaptor subunit [Bryobacteraceae bacterium]